MQWKVKPARRGAARPAQVPLEMLLLAPGPVLQAQWEQVLVLGCWVQEKLPVRPQVMASPSRAWHYLPHLR